MNKDQAQQELAFIKKVMADSQRMMVDNGMIYILWSGLAIFGIIIKYAKEALGIQFNNLWIWIPIIAIGWLILFLYKRKSTERTRVKTFTQKILEGIWTAWGVAIPILAIIGYIAGGVKTWAIPSVIATALGSGHFASGIVTNNSWIRNSAYGWWTGAIVMFFFPGEYAVAVLGVMFFLFQLAPGILLYRKWKQEVIMED